MLWSKMCHIQILDHSCRKCKFKASEADEDCEFKAFKILLSAVMGKGKDDTSTSSSNFSLCMMTGPVAML